MKKIFAILLALSLLLTAAAFAENEVIKTDKTLIKYSKSQGPYTELFELAIIPILEAQGYTFEVVEASDLLVADKMLEDGDVDVNVEQHTAYANNFNANNNGDLTPISVIPTVPAAIYSANHETLDEVADELHSNKTYVSKMVNNTYGVSFPELVNTLRVDYAEQYILSHREAKQSEVALNSGFLSASAFNTVFKKVTGVTPKVWMASNDSK